MASKTSGDKETDLRIAPLRAQSAFLCSSYRYYLNLRWICFILLNEFKVCLWSGSALNEENLVHNAVKRNKKCSAENRLRFVNAAKGVCYETTRAYCFDHKIDFLSLVFPGFKSLDMLLIPFCYTAELFVFCRLQVIFFSKPDAEILFEFLALSGACWMWRRVHTDILHKGRLSLPKKKKSHKSLVTFF